MAFKHQLCSHLSFEGHIFQRKNQMGDKTGGSKEQEGGPLERTLRYYIARPQIDELLLPVNLDRLFLHSLSLGPSYSYRVRKMGSKIKIRFFLRKLLFPLHIDGICL